MVRRPITEERFVIEPSNHRSVCCTHKVVASSLEQVREKVIFSHGRGSNSAMYADIPNLKGQNI